LPTKVDEAPKEPLIKFRRDYSDLRSWEGRSTQSEAPQVSAWPLLSANLNGLAEAPRNCYILSKNGGPMPMNAMNEESRFRGAGGTPGGIAEFVIGLAMAIAGAYLLTNRVVVVSGFWSVWGYNTFGLSLLPLIIGVGILFFNGKSKLGWFLLFTGVVVIFTGILMNLNIYFERTSLFNTIVMIVLLAGGIGLIFRGLMPHGNRDVR
jgi:hypothetical protein